jgi:predicted RNase H-like nuclease (RuvC/YqgF family)
MAAELEQEFHNESMEDISLPPRTDRIMKKLNELDHELNYLRAGMEANSQELEEYQDQLDTMKFQLADKMKAATKINCQYTADLVKDLDSNMDTLASQRSVNFMNRLLTATFIASAFNTVCVVGILIYIILN